MTQEELLAAYEDAMKRLRGSMLGPQLAQPIEDYVQGLRDRYADLRAQLDQVEMLQEKDLIDTSQDQV